MLRPDMLFLALSVVWVASEIWIGRKRAADGGLPALAIKVK